MQEKEEKDKKIHLAIYTRKEIIDIVQALADENHISRSRAGEEIITSWNESQKGGKK